MATAGAVRFEHDQPFFLRMAVGISAFILFGFLQWSARGFVDIATTPPWVHAHALVFASWLGLFVTQSALAGGGSLALHRRLGWLALVLVPAMVALGSIAGIKAVELGRVPPFFGNAYFLALTHVDALAFGGLVGAALMLRRHTEWHRRLMLVAAVVLMEPAFGRLLPMPMLNGWGEWLTMVLQLAVVCIGVAHDRRVRGKVHPAFVIGLFAIAGIHGAISLLAQFPPLVALAERLAAA